MTRSSSYNPSSGHLSCDMLVVGGGIVGLWIARLAQKAGLEVILLEKNRVGSGASGGLLGALMPHMPERWNPKKQFQFEALVSLGDRVAEIEAETGLSCGYRRCGRLLPLAKPHHADLAAERTAEASNRWTTPTGSFAWIVRESGPADGWPSDQAMPHGVVFESLAARINPRLYVAALKASLDRSVAVIEGDRFGTIDEAAGIVTTGNGRTIRAGRVILAAGHESFDLLGRLLNRPPEDFGSAIKGQAALLKADVDPHLPLVFQDGTYVVPHDDGLVAVGSTSERTFEAGFTTDEKLDAVIAAATKLCPALAAASIVERWANLRPKAIKRDPMIGIPPGYRNLLVATGGFKITFGIAHEMARCTLDLALAGEVKRLPDSFRLETHLS
jgi:glycine/D-amino acid oxidase-like deaminating enzyme